MPRAQRLDRQALEDAYRERSRKLHPDRFARDSSVERRWALEHSTRVNDAYRSLRDPQTRAEHLMKLEDADVLREEARTTDRRFLTEMLELQEEIEREKTTQGLTALRDRIASRLSSRIQSLERYFDDHVGTKEESIEVLQELRYVRRLLERIDLGLEEVG